MSRVWESELPTSTHKLVLLAFADYADEDGMCWPSLERIATRSQLSKRQVRRIASRLKEIGLLEVVEKEHQYKTPTYIIREDKLTSLPESGRTPGSPREDIFDIREDKSDTREDVGVLQTTSNHHIEPSLNTSEENDDFFDAWEDATGQYHAADPRRAISIG